MHGPDLMAVIRSYAIRSNPETIQVDCDRWWSFTFPTPEDAVALTLSPPLRLPLYYGSHLLEVETDGDLWSVTLVIHGVKSICTMKLDSNEYSQFVSMVMNSYREFMPVQKI